MRNRLLLVLCLVAFLGCGSAIAGDFYAGFGVGKTEADGAFGPQGFNAEGFGYKLFGGYRFWKFLGVELDYRDFGDPDDTANGFDVTVDLTGWCVAAMIVAPVSQNFELYGKAGLLTWDAETIAVQNMIPLRFTDDGSDMSFGIGAAFTLGDRFAIRAEWETFNPDGSFEQMRNLGLGVEYRF